MGFIRKAGFIAAALLALFSVHAWASDIRVPFLGVWRITKATPAPWTGGTYRSDPFLAQRWIGKRVTFGWNIIDAPYPLGCDAPDYHVVEVAPDELFQGNLTSPILQAHALGFRAGAPVRTLQTDCEHLIDFHFADNSTAMFALDNVIFTLRRR
jgi:hypothetical protein